MYVIYVILNIIYVKKFVCIVPQGWMYSVNQYCTARCAENGVVHKENGVATAAYGEQLHVVRGALDQQGPQWLFFCTQRAAPVP
jgi:hypothetical protein